MNNFIDSVIRFLIKIVILGAFILLLLAVYIIFFSKSNNIPIEDSIAFFMPNSNENILLTTNSENSNFKLNPNLILPIISNNTNNSSNSNSTQVASNLPYFYYNQLNDDAKFIYTALETNINNLTKENFVIDFSTKFNTLLNESNGQESLNSSFQSALDAFFYDHPEIFYIDLTKITLLIKYTSFGPITKYNVSLAPADGNTNYLSEGFTSESNVFNAIKQVQNVRNNFISKYITSDMDDYTKALKVHDALVNTISYDSTTLRTNTHNIYGALVENEVVCEGYAKAFKYILDSLNIECILVSGNATSSANHTEAHMWNYIKLDNNWYGVDVTWDDPVVIGGTNKNITRHTYFAKSSSVFSKTHFLSSKISDNGMSFSYPNLSSRDYK